MIASNASRRRSTRSLRHSFASSTAARGKFVGYRSNFSSNLSNSVSASAAAPAKPASTLPPRSSRTFCALAFMTVSPTVTWPSPPRAALPSRRSARMVVARIVGSVMAEYWRGPASSRQHATQIPRVSLRAPQEQHRSDHDREDAVLPEVARNERDRHRDHTEPDQSLTKTVALATRTTPAFRAHVEIFDQPCVRHQRHADQTHGYAKNDRERFESHPVWLGHFHALGCALRYTSFRRSTLVCV